MATPLPTPSPTGSINAIVWGSSMHTKHQPVECHTNSATQDYANLNIAVQCCELDGSSGSRPGCLEGLTFNAAYTHCKNQSPQLRLCTQTELENDKGQGTGCSFDDNHVWSSTECSSISPTQKPTLAPTGTINMIVWGATSSSSYKPPECQPNAATMDYFSKNIAVQCCELDGSDGSRPDCLQGVTFNEAFNHCKNQSSELRLCTQSEIENGVGKSTGCSFDGKHVWSSTECSSISPSLAPTPSPTNIPTLNPTHIPTVSTPAPTGSINMVVWGATSSSSYQVPECHVNTETVDYLSKTIGVQCCELDGSDGSRPDCLAGVTFNEAFNHCKNQSPELRLCTQSEIENGVGKATGCGFDGNHVWSSTDCISISPSLAPTYIPTSNPTINPTSNPTYIPTLNPTINPTNIPTSNPTNMPTSDPTNEPTIQPTLHPSSNPTLSPSMIPTLTPTTIPSKTPSSDPTKAPNRDGGVRDITTTENHMTNSQGNLNVNTDTSLLHYSDDLLLIIVIILLSLILLLLCFLMCVFCKKKRDKRSKANMKNIELTQQQSPSEGTCTDNVEGDATTNLKRITSLSSVSGEIDTPRGNTPQHIQMQQPYTDIGMGVTIIPNMSNVNNMDSNNMMNNVNDMMQPAIIPIVDQNMDTPAGNVSNDEAEQDDNDDEQDEDEYEYCYDEDEKEENENDEDEDSDDLFGDHNVTTQGQ